MSDDVAIKVDGISKNFKLPHEKTNSLKSSFLQRIKGGKGKYEVQHALKDISFEVKKGEFFGIVGRNGSGKSTLLKILAEIYKPTKGSIKVNGKLVPFIELGVGFNPELTGKDNVYLSASLLGFSRKEISDMYDDIVQFAELEKFMDQKLKNYSSGMQVRLAFSIATRSRADILVLDEVLAVGDNSFKRKCYDYFKELKHSDTTVVFVSHDMGAVQQYCDRAMLIDKNKIVEIDSAQRISTLYNKLFIEETDSSIKSSSLSPSGEERWGDGKIKFQKIEVLQDGTHTAEAQNLTIRCTAKAIDSVEYPIIGFSIKDSKFMQLVGTNTLRENIKLKELSRGQSLTFEWSVQNIFNAGTYYVDCTLAHDDASEVSDRWPEAVRFNIERLQQNPYPLYYNVVNFRYIERIKNQ